MIRTVLVACVMFLLPGWGHADAPPRPLSSFDAAKKAARIWLYMADTYKIKLSAAQQKLFEEWSAADPVDEFERLRDTRIWAAQGNRNPFVK